MISDLSILRWLIDGLTYRLIVGAVLYANYDTIKLMLRFLKNIP